MFRWTRRQSVKLLLSLCACSIGQGLLQAQYVPYPPPYGGYRPYPGAYPAQMVPAPSGYYGPYGYPPPQMVNGMVPAGYRMTPANPPPVAPNGVAPAPVAPANPPPATVLATPAPSSTPAAAPDTTSDGTCQGAAAIQDGGVAANPWNNPNQTIAALGFLGRSEFMNRFNIFENMGALPISRVWTGFDTMDKFQTGFATTSTPGLPLTDRRIVNLYRGGAEIALNDWISFSAQGDYVQSTATYQSNDSWSNPQFTVKAALINTANLVVSPVLGVQVETAQDHGQLHEHGSRVIPGVLFLWAVNDALFLQGGAQFSLSPSDFAQTFDYALSLGYWLYRDSSMDVTGRNTESFRRTAVPFLTGFIPQVDVYGKNVFADANNIPYQTDSGYIPGVTYSGYSEGRNVYDVSAGVRMIFMNHITLAIGYSVPISGPRVSNQEFTSALNVTW